MGRSDYWCLFSHCWGKLFLLPCVLANPSDGDRLGWRELQTIVRRHIRRADSRGRREMKSEALQASNAKLATQTRQYRKVIQALTYEGLSPASESSLEEMLAKHPQPPPPSTPPPLPISVPLHCVSRALRSFPSNSVPGPSLLRANHLREATRCLTASCETRALRAIATTVNLLAARGAPPEIALWCHLTSCEKGKWWSQTYHSW